MKAKNTSIQSAIDYICSKSGFIALDEKDFELTSSKFAGLTLSLEQKVVSLTTPLK